MTAEVKKFHQVVYAPGVKLAGFIEFVEEAKGWGCSGPPSTSSRRKAGGKRR